jgi:uncharacterized protein (DUF433 family)
MLEYISEDSGQCEEEMLTNKPSRKPRQDARNLPTYTIPEAASMLAINQWTLSDWYAEPRPVLVASGTYLDKGHIKLLSFRDLEEAYKVHLLRNVHGKSMQYLQSALVDARKITRSDHPLLDYEIIVFKHLGLDMPPQGKQPRKMIPLGSSTQMSLYIPDVVETWGKRIVPDSKGKGQQIFPWKEASTDEVSRPVSINANVLSGRLVVTGTRIPVQVLMGYYESGRSIEKIAELYKLDVDTVRKAIHHSEPEHQKAS